MKGVSRLITGSSDKGTPEPDGHPFYRPATQRKRRSEARWLIQLATNNYSAHETYSSNSGISELSYKLPDTCLPIIPSVACLRTLATSLTNHSRDTKITSITERNCCAEDGISSFWNEGFLCFANYQWTLKSHPILLVTDENLKLRVGFPFPRAILPVTRGNSILKLYLHGKCFLSLTL